MFREKKELNYACYLWNPRYILFFKTRDEHDQERDDSQLALNFKGKKDAQV